MCDCARLLLFTSVERRGERNHENCDLWVVFPHGRFFSWASFSSASLLKRNSVANLLQTLASSGGHGESTKCFMDLAQ
jgi:hypothetical protein